jgi:solute carrier family 35 protein E3
MNAIGMEIMASMFFERKRLPLKHTVLMALSCTASIVFMNYSLRLNSVGFYQLSKLLGVPWLIFVQQVFYHKSIITKNITFSLCLILIGLGIATVSDVRINLAGAIMSALGVMTTTQYQIWQGEKQSEFNLNALQINHAQALPNFITCALFAALIDGQKKQLYEHVWTSEEILLVFLGCLLALFFNLSTYGILGLTSPLTYQVVGHTKTVLIFSSGFFFDSPKENERFFINLLGLAVTMIGVGLYTLWNMKKEVTYPTEDEIVVSN